MFVWVEPPPPPPPPPSKRTHTLHAYRKNADQEMRVLSTWCGTHGGVQLSEVLGKACDVPGSTEGLFSFFFLSGVGAYRPPFVLRITDSASDGARSWRLRVSSAEDVDKLRLGNEGLHVSAVCNIMDFFVTQTTRKPCKTTRSSPKLPIFLPNEQASTLPPLKRTSFVWNKMPVIGDGPLLLLRQDPLRLF